MVHWHLHVSHGFAILSIVDKLLERALTERGRGRRFGAVCQRSSYGFPSNKFVKIWACMPYEKYPSGIDTFRGAYASIHYQLRTVSINLVSYFFAH